MVATRAGRDGGGGAAPVQSLTIGSRSVGPGHPTMIIGEVAQAHDGSLGLAHAFIDAIAEAGADAVKFQTHIAAAESSDLEPWRTRFSRQDETRFAYWRRMEFTEEQWRGLVQHATERGLLFLSSPFSVEAADVLARLDVPAWKIASGEINDVPMLERIAETRRPLLLSTGMSAWAEIDAAVAWARSKGLRFAVLQTTSAYPCPPESVGLNLLADYRARYACPVGLSDHSGQIYAGLAAVTLGASVVEAHVTLSREMFGPDVVASLTTPELKALVEGARSIERMLAHGVDKDAAAAGTAPLRAMFMKSVVVLADLPAGTLLAAAHLAARKPGTGIPASRLAALVGRRLARACRVGHMLREDDLVPEAKHDP